ncbi:MAG: guanylate kinase [Epulopiscium sp.]|nr:guanylate kinase [Candidatus Epulonipiscium sp.]
MNHNNKGVLIVISGFSGSGKGTVIKELIKNPHYALSVSATTRQPRIGEVEGVHYFFKNKDEFLSMIKNNELLEWAEFCNNYYGTPKQYVEKQLAKGKDVILEIEVQGALQVKQLFPECILIFLTPPNLKILKQRLEKRGTEDIFIIEKRLQRAKEELDYIHGYDYIVINDVLTETILKVQNIVQAEHCKTIRNQSLIRDLKGE